MTRSSLIEKLKPIGSRIRRNYRAIRQILAGRKSRSRRFHDPLRPGQRPQDILAILLLTVGVGMVVFDFPAYPWIRSLPPEYQATFSAITDIGKSHWILWSTGLLCIYLLSLNAARLTFRLRMAVGAAFTYAAFTFYTVAATGILALALKWLIGRARPKLYDQVGPVEFAFLQFNGHAYTSFPSGHATTVAALATALALIFPAWRWLIIVGAFWAAFSRIMVGAHYPSDVIAGTLLGITFTYFSARVLARRRIGFHLSEAGRIEPIMSKISAAACMRALWQVIRGQQSAWQGGALAEAAQSDTDKVSS